GVETGHTLDICLTGYLNGTSAEVHILDGHSNIVEIVRNGKTVFNAAGFAEKAAEEPECVPMSVERILRFAEIVPENRIADIFDRQIAYNCSIAEEGLRGDWGAGIGKMLWRGGECDARTEAMAYAAAGSDARMSGCELPVIILSGSGNQGITASLPVIRYARRIGADREKLLRALTVSALVTIHQKNGIGKLSAYCGAVSAGVGAGAGIAYLLDGSLDAVSHTIVNAVAVLSGTICDGAKPSCAAKITFAVEAGILGYEMYVNNKQFYGGDGIVAKGVDNTIANIGILAKDGMRETDRTIIGIMTRC
ncbi:MAG: serine dehydratase subunit alpha family protein, partial [Clostridia bacterium]|nr:serine dehydratase subunit alpha family protein [Clostridia bacterium]